ncbi:MAG: DUF4123 domain-containing protein [bacterium]
MSEPNFFFERMREELQTARDLWGKQVYAIYDGAKHPGIGALLKELETPASDLFSFVIMETLWHVAPYLAEVKFDDNELEWWRADPNVPAGALFLISDAPLDEVAPHFSRYILVEDYRPKEVIFRFYDPTILHPFLKVSTEAEWRRFFGPVMAMLAHDPEDKPIATDPSLLVWHHPDHHIPFEERSRFSEREEFPFKLRLEHEEAFRKETREKYIAKASEYVQRECLAKLMHSEQPDPRPYVERAMALGPTLGLTSGQMVSMLAKAIVLSDEQTISARLREVPEGKRSVLMREIDLELTKTRAANA